MLWRRLVALALTAAVLYGLAPALLEVFSAWPQVADISPGWFVAMAGAQVASLACMWELQRLAFHEAAWPPVILSNLASAAVSKVLPGGSATAAAVQARMLTQSGMPAAAVGLGLTASSLLLLATLCALPVLAGPAALFGGTTPDQLVQAALVGLGLFLALAALGTVLMTSDGALRWVGRLLRSVLRRVRRKSPPPADLPQRLVDQRNLIRDVLGARWERAVAAAAGKWLLDYLTLLAALAAVGADLNLSLTLLAYCAAALLAQIPLTPGGLGVVEAGLSATLALAGASSGQAVVATLAYRLVTYWLPLPAGLAAWLVYRHRLPAAEGAST